MSAETANNGIDIHTTAGKIADLEARRNDAAHRRSEAVDKQHARGKLTAMERIERLLDEGSFQQIDGLARHRSHHFGMEQSLPQGVCLVTR